MSRPKRIGANEFAPNNRVARWATCRIASTLYHDNRQLTCVDTYAGMSGWSAWDAVPDMANSHSVEDKISRVHLAEEFCHVRLFDEMLKTCGLDKVEWVPLGPVKEKIYGQFPRLPGFLMDTPAFVTELMGVTFYRHLHHLFDEVLADEPEVHERLKELLTEITIDEVAHVGQRRNFIGPIGMKVSKWLVKPFYIYSEGQGRLRITLLALEGSGQTEIRIAPELKGKVEKRGDIKYAPFKPATEEVSDSEDENQAIGVWETLSSNGVLEDRFLAALMDLLRSDKTTRQSGGQLPEHSTP